ncbi:propionyl-CoA synthetase [Amorphus orientalis]|uniref:Propionyl-CoA synthetase n=1 Tax=Amorphus orientalis TaxID=649198 RepID=A0AAE3VM28_9HYPH|nr:propionyl-CoA synthetase [Amorphus orientalis]MDQ0314245.1 propionyl-CoA synthetase [Amorphus orientalis]
MTKQSYSSVYDAWKADPDGFWMDAADAIDWTTPPTRAFDPDAGAYGRWFPDAAGNTCYNCVDRHVERGRPGQAAVIYDSPISGKKRTITYAELKRDVEAMAAVFLDKGVQKGDRVILYMPMIPEALIAMLACARIGAIHSVVFGGFAAHELATRINDSTPKLIVCASCGLEPGRVVAYKPLVDAAVAEATHKPDAVLVWQREEHRADLDQPHDHELNTLVEDAEVRHREVPCVPVAATDPLYILYTSGTTGQPKGVVRDTGGHMVALAWTMKNVYGVEPGEVFWAASDVGWVVGHSYIVYAPLLCGCTTVLFEGKPVGTPDAGTFWRVASEHNVAALFTAPTALRAIKKEDPDGKLAADYNLTSFRTLFLAGERADPDSIQWAERALGVPVIDHWWQTETGWAIAANPVGIELLPVKLGSPTVAMPGYDIQVVDEGGQPVAAGDLGNIVVKLPLPPGCLPTLWGDDARFRRAYLETFPGYYQTADAGYVDEDGYLFIMSRTDDIINVAGHRLSTGAMEEVISGHPAVAECAVIGVTDSLKGQVPCGFIVLKSGVTQSHGEIEQELVKRIRDQIGPVAALKLVVTVERLPKTRSGKILRGTMRAIADGETYRMPATIDDPAILDEIDAAIRQRGVGRQAAG